MIARPREIVLSIDMPFFSAITSSRSRWLGIAHASTSSEISGSHSRRAI
jgi:hypothetical protein